MRKKYIKIPILPISQPIGTFYIGGIKASELYASVEIRRRKESSDGTQRELSKSRIKEIEKYCTDPDATFPTAIIVSVEESSEVQVSIKDNYLEINYIKTFGDVIDGQHRLEGIWASGQANSFELPIVFMINPTIEEKAYVFSIINSKQTKVNPSLIYELFDVSSQRSPQKTAHELARALNSKEDSPLYNRLKMLGKKEEGQDDATLSQGTFSKRIISLISKNPSYDQIIIKKGGTLEYDDRLIFREYFIQDRDDIILKILLNCFSALRNVFYDLWSNPQNNILWKTTGFNAIIDSLPKIYAYGIDKKDLTETFLENVFVELKNNLEEDNKHLVSADFGSGEQATTKLRKYIEVAIKNLNNK